MLGDITASIRAKSKQRLPVVLSRQEVVNVLSRLQDHNRLIASLLYGSGLRVMECLRQRVKDLDSDYQCLHINDGKGKKDRVTTLSAHLFAPLKAQIHQAGLLYQAELTEGFGEVFMLYAPATSSRRLSRTACGIHSRPMC